MEYLLDLKRSSSKQYTGSHLGELDKIKGERLITITYKMTVADHYNIITRTVEWGIPCGDHVNCFV